MTAVPPRSERRYRFLRAQRIAAIPSATTGSEARPASRPVLSPVAGVGTPVPALSTPALDVGDGDTQPLVKAQIGSTTEVGVGVATVGGVEAGGGVEAATVTRAAGTAATVIPNFCQFTQLLREQDSSVQSLACMTRSRQTGTSARATRRPTDRLVVHG